MASRSSHDDLEAMALEESARYRVLRELAPRAPRPPAQDALVRTGLG